MAKLKKKFYAVAVGKKTGIYETWGECEEQVKGFRGARFKGFPTKQEAQQFMDENTPKKETSSSKQRPAKRARHQSLYPRIKIQINFDGGTRGGSKVSGAGAFVDIVTEQQDGSLTRQAIKVRKYLGKRGITNNIAEYNGLLCGLRETKDMVQSYKKALLSDTDGVHIKVIGDSDLVIQQMNGTYQCKSDNLIPLLRTAKTLVADIQRLAPTEITFEHVYRKDNSAADALANEAMDAGQSWTTTNDVDDDDDDLDRIREDAKPLAVSKKRRTDDDVRHV